MAHSSPFVGSIVVLFLCLASCAYSHVPSIIDICSKHRNPSFCQAVLNVKQGSELPCLAKYAIEVAQASATSTKASLGSMVHQTKEIRLMQHYHSCSEHYDDALDSLKKAKDYLESHDFFGMNIAASAVMTNIDDCASSEAPGYDPSVALAKNNQYLENVSVIIMILANRLSGRY